MIAMFLELVYDEDVFCYFQVEQHVVCICIFRIFEFLNVLTTYRG